MNTNVLLGLLYLKKSNKNGDAGVASSRDKLSLLTMLSVADETKLMSVLTPVLYHKSSVSEKEARNETQQIRHQLVKKEAELSRVNGKLLAEISTNAVNVDRFNEEIKKLKSDLEAIEKENEILKKDKLSITKKLKASQDMLKKTSDEIEYLDKQQKKSRTLIENSIQKDLPDHLLSTVNKSRLVRFLKHRLDGGASAFFDMTPSVRRPSVSGLVKDLVSQWKKVMETENKEMLLFMDEKLEVFKDLIKNNSDKPLWKALAAVKSGQLEELVEKIITNHPSEVKSLMDQQIEQMRSLANVSDKLEILSEDELKALTKKVLAKRIIIQHQLQVANAKKIEGFSKQPD
ncbi:MAG: hypothetical protein MI921_24225 [Cytophagales bacterium]|nr:hypothetical protein [Cytophagales bacterium]